MLNISPNNENDMDILFRDLSKNEELNVKTMIEEYEKSHVNSKKLSKKVEKIRENNNKKNILKNIKRDMERMQQYGDLRSSNVQTLDDIRFFKTEYGQTRIKFKLLQIAYTYKNLDVTLELFLQLIDKKTDNTKEVKLMKKIRSSLDNLDYKTYQFEKLSNRLPPLDLYNNHKKKLENWQIKVLEHIKAAENVVVCAKTSMGKTWLGMYPGLIGYNVLFIVPTKPLAYQVASTFIKFMKDSTSIIVKDFIRYNKDNNILVGTPKEIEDNIGLLDIKFDYMVCDEIHNLNNYDGDSYERLIKLFSKKIPFLALSATIGNSSTLINKFEKICGKKVHLVQYSTRFLNLQRHIWKGDRLEKIHPISCTDIGDINEDFLNSNLPLTPYDCIQVYKCLNELFDDDIIDDINIKNLFDGDNRRLTLNDSKRYEDIIKSKIISLNQKYPDKIKSLIDKFKMDVEYITKDRLYSLVRAIKASQMTPCIMFQTNKSYCKEMFITLVHKLEKLETLNFPYHYSNKEFYHNYYIKYTERMKTFVDNIDLGKNEGKIQKDQLKERMIKTFENSELSTYYSELQIRYHKQVRTITNKAISDKIQKIQINNLKIELNKMLQLSTIKDCDIFEKHPNFCVNNGEPMPAEQIRMIRRRIGTSINIKIDYNNVFIQGLKRGIGIYTENMPEIFNQTVQNLAQSGDLGFVISDRTLALGINMPFRSTCIVGYKDSTHFEINDYEQMIGRSGRRGKDTEGHIVYYNVDWKYLMKGKQADIIGKDTILYNYKVLNEISDKYKNDVNNIFENFINDKTIVDSTKIQTEFGDNNVDNMIIWKLRHSDDAVKLWLKHHEILNMKYKKKLCENDVYSFMKYLDAIFNKVSLKHFKDIDNHHYEIVEAYKSNTISENIQEFYSLLEIIVVLHNIYMKSEDHLHIRKILYKCFNDLRTKINRNSCLNKKE